MRGGGYGDGSLWMFGATSPYLTVESFLVKAELFPVDAATKEAGHKHKKTEGHKPGKKEKGHSSVCLRY